MIFNCSKINLICLSEWIAQQQNPSPHRAWWGLGSSGFHFCVCFNGGMWRDTVRSWVPGSGPQGLQQVCDLGQCKDRWTRMEVGMQDRALPLWVTCGLCLPCHWTGVACSNVPCKSVLLLLPIIWWCWVWRTLCQQRITLCHLPNFRQSQTRNIISLFDKGNGLTNSLLRQVSACEPGCLYTRVCEAMLMLMLCVPSYPLLASFKQL